jgi:hypothetical protein
MIDRRTAVEMIDSTYSGWSVDPSHLFAFVVGLQLNKVALAG